MNTNLDEQLKAAAQLEQLWKAVLPNVDAPDNGQFLRWVAIHNADTAAFAVNRTARKFYKAALDGSPMSTDDVRRYVSSVIHNEKTNTRDFRNRQPIGPQHA